MQYCYVLFPISCQLAVSWWVAQEEDEGRRREEEMNFLFVLHIASQSNRGQLRLHLASSFLWHTKNSHSVLPQRYLHQLTMAPTYSEHQLCGVTVRITSTSYDKLPACPYHVLVTRPIVFHFPSSGVAPASCSS